MAVAIWVVEEIDANAEAEVNELGQCSFFTRNSEDENIWLLGDVLAASDENARTLEE